ncbi:YeeE/YedE family protein [Flavobacterium caseinilyticum]|uniref:YeeE/YedE family protein n=1 Tax=Flavobacterium caseinilyticum TaxID=2541732 RepID=UPI0026B5BD56
MGILELIREPWPWYIAGPLVGLTVPALLIIGNKSFGISASLRHTCAMCLPANIKFFKYDWKKEIWNMFFVFGILLGGVIAYSFLSNPNPIIIDGNLKTELAGYGITEIYGMLPEQLFSWESLFTLKGFFMMVIGGFFIGFGSRYAGGCTSGHAISGLSNLQMPSLIATCCFFIGGLIMANVILPFILSL